MGKINCSLTGTHYAKLLGIDALDFELTPLTVVTGPSGSGKTMLLADCLTKGSATQSAIAQALSLGELSDIHLISEAECEVHGLPDTQFLISERDALPSRRVLGEFVDLFSSIDPILSRHSVMLCSDCIETNKSVTPIAFPFSEEALIRTLRGVLANHPAKSAVLAARVSTQQLLSDTFMDMLTGLGFERVVSDGKIHPLNQHADGDSTDIFLDMFTPDQLSDSAISELLAASRSLASIGYSIYRCEHDRLELDAFLARQKVCSGCQKELSWQADLSCRSIVDHKSSPHLPLISIAGIDVLALLTQNIRQLSTDSLSALRPLAPEFCSNFEALRNTCSRLAIHNLTLGTQLVELEFREQRLLTLARALIFGNKAIQIWDHPTRFLSPSDTKRLIDLIGSHIEDGQHFLIASNDEQLLAAAGSVVELKNRELFTEADAKLPSHLVNSPEEPPVKVISIRAPDSSTLRELKLGVIEQVETESFPVSFASFVDSIDNALKTMEARFELLGQHLPESPNRSVAYTVELSEKLKRVHSLQYLPSGQLLIRRGTRILHLLDLAAPLGELLANTKKARELGLSAKDLQLTSAYSPTSSRGVKCPQCNGLGFSERQIQSALSGRIDPCGCCSGLGIGREVSEIALKGVKLSTLLTLPIGELAELLKFMPKIGSTLGQAVSLGLAALSLSRWSSMVSDGERFRLQMASLLSSIGRRTGSLLALNYPLSGFMPAERARLLVALDSVAKQGNCVTIFQ